MLTADESRQLDRLSFGGRSASPTSHAAGSRVARSRGFGVEFHDFMAYQPGDDPRSIDWTIHARLRQLVVRIRRADARLQVHLLVDTSASMGAATASKFFVARQLAAVLAYVGVHRRDAIGLAFFDTAITQAIAPAAGRMQLHRILSLLTQCPCGGRSAIDQALIDYGNAVAGPGLAVVISDFFQPADMQRALRYLLHRGLTPAVVQVIAREELDPGFAGEIELVDAEDPEASPLVVDAKVVAVYREHLEALSADLGEFCASRGLPWMQLVAPCPFDRLLASCVDAHLLTGHG